jgi:hypothetical protein
MADTACAVDAVLALPSVQGGRRIDRYEAESSPVGGTGTIDRDTWIVPVEATTAASAATLRINR